ncbi:hypothetical protein AB0M19_27575 [Streptomyces sp. NPDC051920]|uniref:hypothetical protein n=1 Tax=Streptomyces sp. NPDC051920 TaxID=3155523 RepID=UPI00344A475A
MSRGEQTPGPPAEDAPAVPGEQAPAFTVVIAGDGSAVIDGEPVPPVDGVTVDAAILDALHGYARDRGTTVTATISDPSAGYVASVEVDPDGSSTLVDQREEPAAAPAAEEPAVPGEPAPGEEPATGEEDGEDDLAYDGDEDYADGDDGDDDGFDMEAYTLEQQRLRESRTLPPPPAPDLDPGSHADADLSPDADADRDADPDGEGPGFAASEGFGSSAGRSPVVRPAPPLVRRSGSRQSDDEYEGPGLLHRPLVVGPVALVAAALVIVPLAMLGSGGQDDGGRRTEAARSTGEPSASPRAEGSGPLSTATVSVPPGSSASSSAGPKESKGPKKGSKGSGATKGGGKGAGAVVTVTARPPRATVTARPAQDTAATAVKRLARNDPSGRHICYRAYVSGQGWQKPVCDGTMAGTSGRNSPIKALNIAVSGGGGSAANAFVHDPASSDGRGRWEPQWTAVIADGRDNYIGGTKKSAPVMSGFAINIGSGRICQSAKVHGFDWGAQGCADARPGYVFGGALENDRWLEAVKFTL